MTKSRNLMSLIGVGVLMLAVVGCGGSGSDSASSGDDKASTAEVIRIDGSSTVFPITQAVAEEYQAGSGQRVTIGVSGTGGGFKKFCRGETDITGASRPIKESEIALCAENGIDWVELPVAYDGISVVVHPDNDWVDHLTRAELKKMWQPESQATVTRWSQIREGWPDEEMRLFGPGVDSGTYDYFTKAITGTEHSSRGDFTASEDDNVLVQGVSTDKVALGFFGYAYYRENQDKLRVVPIDDGDDSNGTDAIAPSLETIADGRYQPLSRPVFIYVSKQAAEREEIDSFVDFYLGESSSMVTEVGYIPLPQVAAELAQQRFEARTPGSMFAGGSKVGVTIEQMLRGS